MRRVEACSAHVHVLGYGDWSPQVRSLKSGQADFRVLMLVLSRDNRSMAVSKIGLYRQILSSHSALGKTETRQPCEEEWTVQLENTVAELGLITT